MNIQINWESCRILQESLCLPWTTIAAEEVMKREGLNRGGINDLGIALSSRLLAFVSFPVFVGLVSAVY